MEILLIQYLASILFGVSRFVHFVKTPILYTFIFILCYFLHQYSQEGYIHNQGVQHEIRAFFLAFVFHCVPKIFSVIFISKNNKNIGLCPYKQRLLSHNKQKDLNINPVFSFLLGTSLSCFFPLLTF